MKKIIIKPRVKIRIRPSNNISPSHEYTSNNNAINRIMQIEEQRYKREIFDRAIEGLDFIGKIIGKICLILIGLFLIPFFPVLGIIMIVIGILF